MVRSTRLYSVITDKEPDDFEKINELKPILVPKKKIGILDYINWFIHRRRYKVIPLEHIDKPLFMVRSYSEEQFRTY